MPPPPRFTYQSCNKMYPESALCEDVNWRTIEIIQRTPILEANRCLKVHNVPFKLASSISA